MFGIEVTFLTGRYIASSYNNRKKAEWPPHPARMYSALVAEYAEAGFMLQEKKALEWLESLDHPEIHAPLAVPRNVVGNFVPVNDAAIVSIKKNSQLANEIEELTIKIQEMANSNDRLIKIDRVKKKRERRLEYANSIWIRGTDNTNPESAVNMLPDQRVKQLRHFPSSTPESPKVTFIWQGECSQSIEHSLGNLLSRVTRLGHSSSLVSCRITDRPPKANYKPSDLSRGMLSIRGIRPGQLTELERQHKNHQAYKPRVLPFEIVHYLHSDAESSSAQPFVEPSSSGDWIVFEFAHESRYFLSTRSHEIAKTMRAAIFRYLEDPIPEEISGHKPDGTPTKEQHISFQPIPFVGSQHADGRLLGIAIAIPRSISTPAKRALIKAIGKWEQSTKASGLTLYLATSQVVYLHRLNSQSSLKSLQQSTWSRHSCKWTSVIPIALPRHPGRLFGGTHAARRKAWRLAEQSVIQSCAHVNLPNPVKVSVSFEPYFKGCKSSRAYPPLRYNNKDASKNSVSRQLIHATLEFKQPIRGPFILGSGRFLGLGLMLPVFDHDES